MQKNRLSSGGAIDRSKPLTFYFAGRTFSGYAGDTLASALLANGVDVVARSFKYGRPRGVMSAGAEEPNAIVQLGATEATQTPNVRATQQALFAGLVSHPTNGWPSIRFDLKGLIGSLFGRFMPPGFYYKTFMFPQSLWMFYERHIRRAAGLGQSPIAPDSDTYDHLHHHVDVLVVGAGPAGLMAALTAARAGARVIVVDEQEAFGGSLLCSQARLNDEVGSVWVQQVVQTLAAEDRVLMLPRTTANGYHDHNFVTLHERRTDHLGDQAPAGMTRQRMHRVRAEWVILCTGAHERPLVFAHNDVPGCFVARSLSTYVRRYAVAPGERLVLSTNNDYAYQSAFDWQDAGRTVVAIVDARAEVVGVWQQAAERRGLRLIKGAAVTEVKGARRVRAAAIAMLSPDQRAVVGALTWLDCDTVATSGGWSPAVHLSCHTGSRPVWHEQLQGFVPGPTHEQVLSAGILSGQSSLPHCLKSGYQAAVQAVTAAGYAAPDEVQPTVQEWAEQPMLPLFAVPHPKPKSRAPKQFVDWQNDVTADAIELATREGFTAIEHVKRYTALGFGTDQGKLSNINGMAIAAQALGQTIAETGTTVFRPNYTPITFGAIVGRHCGDLFEPKRFTALHPWHVAQGAEFENVGQWMRPWYFPKPGESMQAALARECLATRNSVGVLDASTLGKIDIQGPDAREFIGRVYTNAWAKLAPGRCRYGLMCGEDGMIFDDGVTACLSEQHFQMSTTTGGAARVLEWLELYHQTEWPQLQVYFNSVTDHWASISVAGPNSRKVLQAMGTDIDLSAENFKFMDWRQGQIAGVPCRIFRISFTGELQFEINVPAHYAVTVWEQLFAAGAAFNITPYGTETMHILRAEKGFIIAGQDTDGSVHPYDLGMGWAVSMNKPYSFIGKRGLQRADCVRPERKQWVGLKTLDPQVVLPEGAQAVADPQQAKPMTLLGHITSSYYSAFLGRSFAQGFIKNGLERMGETVYYPLTNGQMVAAEICSPVFVDLQGDRQNV